ncbi:MAG: enoyl-CoA hydratase [Proteobacteria bacterium]|nr:enoyl-CoA hydratase [Pseudomonadota bacterium]
MEQEVLFEIKDQVALITLNRPERRNAMNQALLSQLYDAVERVASDDTIMAAIITGQGKAFCSGIDLGCLGKDNLFDPRGDGSDMLSVFSACTKPIIGAVNGPTITGGFELALNCDFLIASEHACFADTHAKVGIHPGWGITQLLQQAVGQRMAKQMSLTCQFISAEKALAVGLVNEVVPAEHLLDRAFEIAGQICAVNPLMMMTVKALIENRNTGSFDQGMDLERQGFNAFTKAFR